MKIEKKPERPKVSDQECIAEWRLLLSAFKNLIEDEPPAESIKSELEELKERAKNSIFLNFRQMEAIVARCENYLKGNYGHSKDRVETSSYDKRRQEGKPKDDKK